MKARKLLIVVVSIVGIAFLLTMCPFEYAEAQKVIEWRMLSGWSAENPNVKNFLVPFVERVNQKAAGQLKISWVGPEAVSPLSS
jgi:TRAP-type mannitol/chloroaromatic compound transport system substrate-binding protein